MTAVSEQIVISQLEQWQRAVEMESMSGMMNGQQMVAMAANSNNGSRRGSESPNSPLSQISHHSSPVRNYSFLSSPQNHPIYMKPEPSDKYKDAKKRKARREMKRDNKETTVTVEGDKDSYDLEKALQSLGIEEKPSKGKKAQNGINAVINGNSLKAGKKAKKNSKDNKVPDNSVKVNNDNEGARQKSKAANGPVSKNQNASEKRKNNKNNNTMSAVLTNGNNLNNLNNNNAKRAPEDDESDEETRDDDDESSIKLSTPTHRGVLRSESSMLHTEELCYLEGGRVAVNGEHQDRHPLNQFSRSTENLSSFTTVTSKKRRGPKKHLEHTQSFHQNGSNASSSRPFAMGPRIGPSGNQHQRPSSEARGAKQSQQQSEDYQKYSHRAVSKTSSSTLSSHSQSPAKDISLVAEDFPPLDGNGELHQSVDRSGSVSSASSVEDEQKQALPGESSAAAASVWDLKNQQRQHHHQHPGPVAYVAPQNQSFASVSSSGVSPAFSPSSCTNVTDKNIDSDCLAVIDSPSSSLSSPPSSSEGASASSPPLSSSSCHHNQSSLPSASSPANTNINSQAALSTPSSTAQQPDLTKDCKEVSSHQQSLRNAAATTLPDITSGVPTGIIVSSGENTPQARQQQQSTLHMGPPPPGMYPYPAHTHAHPPPQQHNSAYESLGSGAHSASRDLSSRNSTASFNVDPFVEVVTSPEEYDIRDENATPVVILDKGANPLDAWGNSEISFGFDINPEFVSGEEELQFQQQQSEEDETAVTPKPDEAESLSGPPPPVSHEDPSIIFTGELPSTQQQATVPAASKVEPLSQNHLELIRFVSSSWREVERQLQKKQAGVHRVMPAATRQ